MCIRDSSKGRTNGENCFMYTVIFLGIDSSARCAIHKNNLISVTATLIMLVLPAISLQPEHGKVVIA